MEHGQETMTIVDENGDEHVCEVILTFESKDYGKSYVLYHILGKMMKMMRKLKSMHLPLLPTEDGEEDGELIPIEDDEEWEMVEETLNTFLAEEEEEEE